MTGFNVIKDKDNIAVVTMDMSGPVNAINAEFRESMEATLDKLESDSSLIGVVFESAKKTFFAGGDLNWLLSVRAGDEKALYSEVEHQKSLLRRLEKLPVPVVAAINGAALGGGFELCLACNHRVALNSPEVSIGLPEIHLGLFPGGGGVVRLVNLIGIESAVPLLLEGKKVGPAKARSLGLIHDLVDNSDDLVPRAKKFILGVAGDDSAAVQPWDKKGYSIPGGKANSPKVAQFLSVLPAATLAKTRGRYPAAQGVLDCAVEAGRLDFDTALRVESRKFANVVTTPVAKNMISTFFFGLNKINGGVSRPSSVDSKSIKTLGVIGAGMMGQGIAYSAALNGIEVVLKDVSIDAADEAKERCKALLDNRVRKGKLSEERSLEALHRISTTADYSALEDCDLVIEAVFENAKLKDQVTREAEPHLKKTAIWGSNTSTLPISMLSESSSYPENFIGIHFFSPVDKMPLVEIIRGEKTSDDTLAFVFDFVKEIGKTPIVVNDSLGFYTSRTIISYLDESASMVAEGINPAKIENIARWIGMPVGPLALQDEVSLSLGQDIRNTHVELGLRDPKDDATPLATRMLNEMVHELGRAGRKVGKGFYDYTAEGKSLWPGLMDRYYDPDNGTPNEDIEDRLLFRPILESLRCYEEGVLGSVEDANIGSIFGIGAPAWTGGYLQFVNTYGLHEFAERCKALAKKYGSRFDPPRVLLEKASSGQLID